jgi:uncharacterized lipoprotein NlpE involved in copper resistance
VRQIIGVVAISMLLVGCDNSQVRDAKRVVREQLVDPKSAQFENVVVQEEESNPAGDRIVPVQKATTCGWVNSKNRMGGYTGAERFIVREGIETFGSKQTAWNDIFARCIVYSANKAANDRLDREYNRARTSLDRDGSPQ